MHATPFLLPSDPQWQRQARSRLGASCLVATLLVAIVLGAVRFPVVQILEPAPEILIRLLPAIIEPLTDLPLESAAEPIVEPAPADAEVKPEPAPDAGPEHSSTAEPAETSRPAPDWYGSIKSAAVAAVDELEQVAAVNPAMDEKRRRAAGQFYASRAPKKTYIWDNVETDQLGRKILWSGDCYRIIDDPNPATYEIWREFQQYFIYCRFGQSEPQMLPWVEDIRDQYLYLQYPDGEIPRAELREYVER